MSLEKTFEEKYVRLLNDLKGETDRASVIIVTAHIDTQLDAVLRMALVPSPKSSDAIFDGPNAPLSNLNNKIDFCHRLGLISEFSARTIHIIRRIRNRFAHNIEGCTFEDSSIKAQVYEIYKLHQFDRKKKVLCDIFGDSTKGKFLLSATLVMGVLEEIYHRIGPNSPARAEWPYEWLLKG